MEDWKKSNDRASEYPTNLVFYDAPDSALRELKRELENQAERLFCASSLVRVNFLEIQRPGYLYYLALSAATDSALEPTTNTAHTYDELHTLLGSSRVEQEREPYERFM